jgi:hypothetical protein
VLGQRCDERLTIGSSMRGADHLVDVTSWPFQAERTAAARSHIASQSMGLPSLADARAIGAVLGCRNAGGRLRDGIRDGLTHLPGGVWAVGFTSLFMDTSSELVHNLLPIFLATVLGASMTTIGVLEGTPEATAAISKVFSDTVSDYLGRRKLLVVLGYGLAAATKPIFPLAVSVSM